MEMIEKLNWRYATKQFSGDSPSGDKIDEILESARLAASSFGLQPFRVIVVKDAEVRKKLREAAFGQPQITDATLLLVFARMKTVSENDVTDYMHNISKTRNIPLNQLDGFKSSVWGKAERLNKAGSTHEWTARQAYIALGTVLTTAAVLGVDACPMEGFNPDEFDEILGLTPLGLTATVLCPIGIRSPDDAYQHLPKVRVSNDKFFITI